MRRFLLAIVFTAASLATGHAQKQEAAEPSKGIVVAFYDVERLHEPDAKVELENFQYFYKLIEKIARRDFPEIEFKLLKPGELIVLPDGSGLNLETLQPKLGYVFAVPGKPRRLLTGAQSDSDFACAASDFFQRPSSACKVHPATRSRGPKTD